jgi:hypothetical protein
MRRGKLPPPPSPPAAEEDDEVEQESEENGGGEDEERGGGEDEEDLSEDEGFGGLPFEADPNLVWEPPEEEEYVTREERLQPSERKPYQHGKTQLPKLKTWSSSDVVLVPAGKRYMLILTFCYRNFIIIKKFMTYILILPFHCAVRSSLPTRRGSRDVATRTSLEAYLGSISLGLSISLVVAAMQLRLGGTTAMRQILMASTTTCRRWLYTNSEYVTSDFLAFKHSLVDNSCTNAPYFTYVHGCSNTSRGLRVMNVRAIVSYTRYA